MRALYLKQKARDACDVLAPPGTPEREALESAVYRLMDESAPLVDPDDRSITHGSVIMGRAVPGTDLVVCYVPAGDEVYVINVVRR